jgi:hypothetical protein
MPPDRVPTLTEVVAWPQGGPGAARAAQQLPLPSVETGPAEADMADASTPVRRATDEQLIQGVLAEVQRQVDLVLEYRLRELLTPLLARAADSMVREARTELASTLRDVVARAVAQELARHRIR